MIVNPKKINTCEWMYCKKNGEIQNIDRQTENWLKQRMKLFFSLLFYGLNSNTQTNHINIQVEQQLLDKQWLSTDPSRRNSFLNGRGLSINYYRKFVMTISHYKFSSNKT